MTGCSLTLSTPAIADDAITVIGTGQPERLDQSGQSIAVVDMAEIESVQGPDITRLFQRLPGITLTRNGGLGSFTGVRIRGADSEQTLVLIDGARVADVSNPGSGFDFGTLLSGSIGKIELLRGSNSTAWGSDAIGGVIALTTRKIKGVETSLEYGANYSLTGTAAAGFESGGLWLSVNGGYSRTDGISALASDTERDGFRQWQAGSRANVELGGNFSAFADARYARSVSGIDFSFANDYTQTTRQASGRTGLRYASDSLDMTAAFSLADTHRGYSSPFFGYEYNGQNRQLDVRGKWKATGQVSLLFGAGHTWDRYDGTFDARKTARQASGHAMLEWSAGVLNVAAGARIDHHSRFGDAWTTGANGSLGLGGGWRLRASYGEGFKAPTLFQLYGFAGNPALRPERSRSYDGGIEMGDRGGALHFAATLFRRDSRSLIDYDANANGGWGGYFNISRTRATGFELEAGVRPVESLQLQAVYSYVKAENRITRRDLYRRPRHALTLAGDWASPFYGLVLGADLRLVGTSMDDPVGDTDTANDVRLASHVVLTLRASVPVNERIELFGRIENLADAHYQAVAGYNTPGRSAYVGARARF